MSEYAKGAGDSSPALPLLDGQTVPLATHLSALEYRDAQIKALRSFVANLKFCKCGEQHRNAITVKSTCPQDPSLTTISMEVTPNAPDH